MKKERRLSADEVARETCGRQTSFFFLQEKEGNLSYQEACEEVREVLREMSHEVREVKP